MKKTIFFVSLVLIFLFLLYLFFRLNYKETGNVFKLSSINKSANNLCVFEIRDVKIEKNDSDINRPYFKVMGFLKGNKDDFVDSIFSEARTNDDKKIFIASSSQSISRKVINSDAVPFTILLYPDMNNLTIKEAMNNGSALKFDSYPNLSSCSWKDNVSYLNINITK